MELLLGSKLAFFQTICIIDVSRRFAIKGQSVQIWRANRATSSHEIAETGECEACYDPLLPFLKPDMAFSAACTTTITNFSYVQATSKNLLPVA